MAAIDELLAALEKQPGQGRQSPVYAFLWTNYAKLQSRLTPRARPNWAVIAEEFARLGVLDGRGKPPTAERVRKVWWQVGKDKAGVITRRKRTPQPAPAAATQPARIAPVKPTLPVAVTPDDDDDDDDDGMTTPSLR